jgi:hypothetical protein
MRGWVLFFILAGSVACSSSSSGGGPEGGVEVNYSGTNCPAESISATTCMSCVQSKCASQVSSLSSNCTSIEINCFCTSGSTPDSCPATPGCAMAGSEWTSCVQANCATPCAI